MSGRQINACRQCLDPGCNEARPGLLLIEVTVEGCESLDLAESDRAQPAGCHGPVFRSRFTFSMPPASLAPVLSELICFAGSQLRQRLK